MSEPVKVNLCAVDETAESTSAKLRRVEQERDTLREVAQGNKRHVAALTAAYESVEQERDLARAELDAERDKRAEDIAAYEHACGLAVVAERERDELARTLADMRRALASAGSTIQALLDSETAIRNAVAPGEDKVFPLDRIRALQAELASARTELDAVRTARDNLDRQLAAAHAEIRQLDADLKLCPRCGIELNADLSGGTPALASWIVARDGGRDCVRCDQEIRRGEAYELLPGIDQLAHVHCRDPEPTPTNQGAPE